MLLGPKDRGVIAQPYLSILRKVMCNVPKSINMMVLGVRHRDWEGVEHHLLGEVERPVLRRVERKSSKERKVEVSGSAIKIILTVTTVCALHQRLNSSQVHLKKNFGGCCTTQPVGP